MKEASRKTKIIAGGFVAIASVVLTVVILIVGDDFTYFKGRTRFYTEFGSTDGLSVGAPLKMGGVEIGNVEEIVIRMRDSTPSVAARLVVFSPFEKLVKEDSEVGLDTQGVLGDKFLSLTPGSANAPLAEDGATLLSKERTGISSVVAKSTDIMNSVGDVVEKLKLLSESLPDKQNMKIITENIRESTTALNETLQRLNSKSSAVHTLGEKQTAEDLNASVRNLRQATEHFASMAKKVDEGKGTLGALVNDSSLYDDMKDLMGRANRNKALKFIIQNTLNEPEPKVEKPK